MVFQSYALFANMSVRGNIGYGLPLLDQPRSALNAALRGQLKNELAKLLRQFGVTAIFVNHDQQKATAIADRVKARVAQIGTHILAKGQLACGHSGTAAVLHAATKSNNDRPPAPGPVDCAIITGDLTDHGAKRPRNTPIPQDHGRSCLAVAGDVRQPRPTRRPALRAPRSRLDARPGPMDGLRDFGAFAVIALDTLPEGAHPGK